MTKKQQEIINEFTSQILKNGIFTGPSSEHFDLLEDKLGFLTPEMEVYFVSEFDYRRNWPFARGRKK